MFVTKKFSLSVAEWNKLLLVGQILVLGYLMHFLPYFLSERTLFLHHYLAALLFKIMLFSAVLNHLTSNYVPSKLVPPIYIALLSIVCYTFVRFLPLSYGIQNLTAQQVIDLKWKKTWHLLTHK